MDDTEITEMDEFHAERVDAVAGAANGTPFLVTKAQGATTKQEPEKPMTTTPSNPDRLSPIALAVRERAAKGTEDLDPVAQHVTDLQRVATQAAAMYAAGPEPLEGIGDVAKAAASAKPTTNPYEGMSPAERKLAELSDDVAKALAGDPIALAEFVAERQVDRMMKGLGLK
jgi:phage terminase small subunit